MEKQKLPDTELKVMQAIWHIEPPASTSAVREELQKERPWNLSALQTLLGRLVRRGFLQTEKQGKSRYYTPLVTERTISRRIAAAIFRNGRVALSGIWLPVFMSIIRLQKRT